MKIDKKSNNSFRCVLTAKDLEDRQIRVDELSYGSAKTRKLFKDMIWEAEEHYGVFLAGEPLVIEATPLRNKGLWMEFSVMEDSEELDFRYSEFTLAGGSRDTDEDDLGADDLLREQVDDFLMRELSRKKPGREDILKERNTDAEKTSANARAEAAGNGAREEAAAKVPASAQGEAEQEAAGNDAREEAAAKASASAQGEAEQEAAGNDAREEAAAKAPASAQGEAEQEAAGNGAREEGAAKAPANERKEAVKLPAVETQAISAEEMSGNGSPAGQADAEQPEDSGRQDPETDEKELRTLAEAELLDPEEESDTADLANSLREQIEEGLRKIFPNAMVESVDMTTVRVTGNEDMDDFHKKLMKAFADKMRAKEDEVSDMEDDDEEGLLSDSAFAKTADEQRKSGRRGRASHSRQNLESIRVYRFATLEDVLAGAVNVSFFKGMSVLFHGRDGYSLALRQGDSELRDFNRVCNVLSEYGSGRPATPASVAYLAEHDQIIFRGNAIGELTKIDGRAAEETAAEEETVPAEEAAPAEA